MAGGCRALGQQPPSAFKLVHSGGTDGSRSSGSRVHMFHTLPGGPTLKDASCSESQDRSSVVVAVLPFLQEQGQACQIVASTHASQPWTHVSSCLRTRSSMRYRA